MRLRFILNYTWLTIGRPERWNYLAQSRWFSAYNNCEFICFYLSQLFYFNPSCGIMFKTKKGGVLLVSTAGEHTKNGVISQRQIAFKRYMAEEGHVCGFYSWDDVLRNCRSVRLDWIKRQLNILPPEQRTSHYVDVVSPKLSGCECIYTQWLYNLFGDDDTRKVGVIAPYGGPL
jgi:hypothetical protein